jgi:hypothetical protein
LGDKNLVHCNDIFACDLVRILDPIVFVQSKHKTQTASAELLSGFQILSYLFNPSIEPKIACAIFGLFIFKRLSKQVLNALKTKKPGTFVLGFLLVTSSGFKLLRRYVQWTKRLYSLRSFGHFSFYIPFANEFATALNEKCPPHSGRHFVRVTSSGFKPETFRAVI